MKATHLLPLAALVACSAHKPVAPKTMNEAPTENDPQLAARLEPLVRDRWVGALSLAIVDEKGERFLSLGEAQPGVAATADTPFEIGSVSKTFTALALASMVQDHGVTLETEVKALLPASVNVPRRGDRAITLADLATHTSGLPRLPTNFSPANPRDPYADYDAPKLYAFLAGYELTRAPGETYEYSNLGFGLLGHALAQKNGSTYDALLRARVFAPLGMSATSADGHADPKLAIGHDADGSEVGPWKLDALAGAGQVRSTARDMARYLRAQLGGGPLAAAIALTHEKRHALSPADSGDIALGWHIAPDGVTWHNGETAGAHSFVAFDAKRRVGIALLATGATAMIDRVGKDVLAIVRGEAPGPSPLPETLQLAPTALEPLVGTYRVSPSFALVVTRDGARLSVQATGQPRLGLYPEAPDLFYLRAVDAKIRFVREGEKITGLVLLQDGHATAANRT
jgi:CubicO group peptidase (beta-lactamase class C family)